MTFFNRINPTSGFAFNFIDLQDSNMIKDYKKLMFLTCKNELFI